jgi:hypothetical protein
LAARLTANSFGSDWALLDVGGASPLVRAGSLDRGGRCRTLRRWSTRKRPEVRIVYAPPPQPQFPTGGYVVGRQTGRKAAVDRPHRELVLLGRLSLVRAGELAGESL